MSSAGQTLLQVRHLSSAIILDVFSSCGQCGCWRAPRVARCQEQGPLLVLMGGVVLVPFGWPQNYCSQKQDVGSSLRRPMKSAHARRTPARTPPPAHSPKTPGREGREQRQCAHPSPRASMPSYTNQEKTNAPSKYRNGPLPSPVRPHLEPHNASSHKIDTRCDVGPGAGGGRSPTSALSWPNNRAASELLLSSTSCRQLWPALRSLVFVQPRCSPHSFSQRWRQTQARRPCCYMPKLRPYLHSCMALFLRGRRRPWHI